MPTRWHAGGHLIDGWLGSDLRRSRRRPAAWFGAVRPARRGRGWSGERSDLLTGGAGGGEVNYKTDRVREPDSPAIVGERYAAQRAV